MPVTRARLIAGAAAAALTVATVGGVVLAARPDRSPRAEPSPEAVAAYDLLAAPSVVGPLPDSIRMSATTYEITGTCADARAVYLGPGAPVPPESVLTEQGSSIVVTQPWAVSGVLFVDRTGTCRYEILQAPTLTIETTGGPVPAGQFFGRTICSEPEDADETFTLITEVSVDAQPHLLVVGEGTVALAPGSLVDIAALTNEPPPIAAQAVVDGSMDTGFTGTISHADGSTATISGSCTGSAFELIPT